MSSEIKSTKNYNLFHKSPENREISKQHVARLVRSIESKNLLHMRPIEVDKSMFVLDGQHRLEAAKILEVSIFYKVQLQMTMEDVIVSNSAQKQWAAQDVFHYYCAKGQPEYLKLKKFIADEGISFSNALAMARGRDDESIRGFRMGEFEFKLDEMRSFIATARELIDYIKTIIGHKQFLLSSHLFRSLVIFLKHEEVDIAKFRTSLEAFVHKFTMRTNQKEYINFFIEIYNYKRKDRLHLEAGDFLTGIEKHKNIA